MALRLFWHFFFATISTHFGRTKSLQGNNIRLLQALLLKRELEAFWIRQLINAVRRQRICCDIERAIAVNETVTVNQPPAKSSTVQEIERLQRNREERRAHQVIILKCYWICEWMKDARWWCHRKGVMGTASCILHVLILSTEQKQFHRQPSAERSTVVGGW